MAKRLRVVHASGNTFMGLGKTQADIRRYLGMDPEPLWITLTETGQSDTLRAISQVVRDARAPYNLLNPDKGDISFLIHHDAHLKSNGGKVIIPAQGGKASEGAHAARCNSYAELEWRDETIFANGVHFVTRIVHEPRLHERSEQQVIQANAMGLQMSQQAHGRHLAIGSGDLNGQLPNRDDLQEVFNKYHMTTTAKETGNMTGTHDHARIDYVWTMDKDGRVSVEDMKVLKSGAINSDHDPIVVDLLIH